MAALGRSQRENRPSFMRQSENREQDSTDSTAAESNKICWEPTV